MGEGLTEVYDEMFYVGVSIEWEGCRLFLFGNSLTVDTFAHDGVEVFNGYGTEVEYFYDFDFELYSVSGRPCFNHGVHEFTGILIEEHSDKIDNKILYTLLNLKPAQSEVKLFVVGVKLIEFEQRQTLHWYLVVLHKLGYCPAAGHCDEQLA